MMKKYLMEKIFMDHPLKIWCQCKMFWVTLKILNAKNLSPSTVSA